MRKLITGVLCAFVGAAALSAATKAVASTITYTESAFGSGTLKGVSFRDAAITMTGVADTNGQFFLSNQFGNPLTSLTIDISGFAPVTYNGSIAAFAFANANAVPATVVGFGEPDAPASVILATVSQSLTGYQLVTAIGPVSDFGGTDSRIVPTTGGDFILTDVGQATFTATLSAPVPESSTWATMILGFASLGFMAYRRRNRASALTAA